MNEELITRAREQLILAAIDMAALWEHAERLSNEFAEQAERGEPDTGAMMHQAVDHAQQLARQSATLLRAVREYQAAALS